MHRFVSLIFFLPVLLSAFPDQDTLRIGWDNRIGFNAALQKGNSSTLAFGGDLKINRNNPWKNEWTLSAGGLYQADREEVINQAGEIALRFAWSVTRKLYNFYRLALYHNKINGISGQVLPTIGLGYWFSDTKTMKLLLESGGGYNQIAYYGDSTAGEAVLQARFFAEYLFLDNFTIGNNTYYFPGRSMHQVKSSSYFTLLIKHLAAKFEWYADYNSRPVSNLAKMDYQLKSGIEWHF
jgi:putative salt-induced outer membrane protein YdiY